MACGSWAFGSNGVPSDFWYGRPPGPPFSTPAHRRREEGRRAKFKAQCLGQDCPEKPLLPRCRGWAQTASGAGVFFDGPLRFENRIEHREERESMVFDDTYDHEARNETDGERDILLLNEKRLMCQPMAVLNDLVLGLLRYTPVLQNARENQKQWSECLGYADVQHSASFMRVSVGSKPPFRSCKSPLSFSETIPPKHEDSIRPSRSRCCNEDQRSDQRLRTGYCDRPN